MTEATAVKRSTVQETGTMLANGLPFTDGDVELALSIVIKKFEGNAVTLTPAKAAVEAVEADEEKSIAAREAMPAVPAVELIVGEESRVELLGAIAGLPALRSMFTETVAERIAEAREGDTDFAKLLKGYLGFESKLADARANILKFDMANAPGFDIEELVEWSPTEEPEPKSFAAAGVVRGTRTRKRSTVTWSLLEYIPGQRTIEGPDASYHGVRLVKLDGSWVVETNEGRAVLTESDGTQVSVTSSPNKAMRGLLVTCGLSPQRSANDFWNGSEQEKAAA